MEAGMKTLEQMYDEWAAKSAAEPASELDRQELKRAFYAGARVMFTSFVLVNQFETADALSADRWLDSVGLELIAFNDEVEASRDSTAHQ
jgi:hypothetical protein